MILYEILWTSSCRAIVLPGYRVLSQIYRPKAMWFTLLIICSDTSQPKGTLKLGP